MAHGVPPTELRWRNVPLLPAGDYEDDQAGRVQTLGESGNVGYLLLRLLSLNGWRIDIRPAFAGVGVIVSARLEEMVVFQQGDSVADVATEVVKEATRRQREAARRAA